jgi:ABC-type microcin C transport system permease subunit YejB
MFKRKNRRCRRRPDLKKLQEKRMQDRAFVKKYSLQVEITLCLIMVLIIYMVSARLDLLEALFQFTQTHEAWELDELVPTAAFSSVVLMVFAFRRWMVSRALRKRLSRKVDELI